MKHLKTFESFKNDEIQSEVLESGSDIINVILATIGVIVGFAAPAAWVIIGLFLVTYGLGSVLFMNHKDTTYSEEFKNITNFIKSKLTSKDDVQKLGNEVESLVNNSKTLSEFRKKNILEAQKELEEAIKAKNWRMIIQKINTVKSLIKSIKSDVEPQKTIMT